MLRIIEANTKEQIEIVRDMFKEYAEYLQIDLDFQNFNEELANLPGDYSTPSGSILLAYFNNHLAGCIALRKYNKSICEIKRLYVKQDFQGLKIGRKLTQKVIDKARIIGYKSIRLDTLPTMKKAIKLYLSLGFSEIKPYRYNPIEGARYFELKL
ncbi:MAG: GNAT family N-acetyltransferase [Candidatus Hodarchaeota archaeon]